MVLKGVQYRSVVLGGGGITLWGGVLEICKGISTKNRTGWYLVGGASDAVYFARLGSVLQYELI